MPKQAVISAVGATLTIATIGTTISIVAGLLTIVYTVLRIIDWVELRRERKAKINDNTT